VDAFFAEPGCIFTNLCISYFSKFLFYTLFFVLVSTYLNKSILYYMEFTKNNNLFKEYEKSSFPTFSQELCSKRNNKNQK
jgi:hypothetical protein